MKGRSYNVYVMKRPGVDEFLNAVSKDYELVIFTASVQCYGHPIISKLDPNHLIKYRVFRDNCTFVGNGFTKDLRKLGRDLKDTIIIDNCPLSYMLQPNNAIPIKTWLGDKTDTQLKDLISVVSALSKVPDVRESLKKIVKYNHIDKNFALKILKEEIINTSNHLVNKEESRKTGLEVTSNPFAERRQARAMSIDKNTNTKANKPAPINDMQRFVNIKYNPYVTKTATNTNNKVPLIDSAISMIKRPQTDLMVREPAKTPVETSTELPKTAKINYHYRSMDQSKPETETNNRQSLIGINFFNPLKKINKDKANVYQLSKISPYPTTHQLRNNTGQYRKGH